MAEKMKIITYPDPVLRTNAGPVENIDGDTQKLIDNMAETMYLAPGIGLAAVQVGVPLRLIVFDVPQDSSTRNLNVLINPQIVSSEGSVTYEEACLSVIDYSAEVTRSARIFVKGLDRDGNPMSIEAEGLEAVCLQHEIDHLNGVLYIDHISSLKRSLYKKRLKKILKKQTL